MRTKSREEEEGGRWAVSTLKRGVGGMSKLRNKNGVATCSWIHLSSILTPLSSSSCTVSTIDTVFVEEELCFLRSPDIPSSPDLELVKVLLLLLPSPPAELLWSLMALEFWSEEDITTFLRVKEVTSTCPWKVS
jgi:hypothetical protein